MIYLADPTGGCIHTRALIEVYSEDEYEYVAFATKRALIRLI